MYSEVRRWSRVCEYILNKHISKHVMNLSRRVDVNMLDRQTDILLTEIKVITDLFVIVIREIYVHVYTRMLVC